MDSVTVQSKGIEMTPAIREYAEEKIMTLNKFFDGITKADILVGMRHNSQQKGKVFFAEVNLDLPGKHSIHLEKESSDLYKAIDKVKDHLKVDLEKMKGKMHAKDQEVIRESKAYHLDDIE